MVLVSALPPDLNCISNPEMLTAEALGFVARVCRIRDSTIDYAYKTIKVVVISADNEGLS